MAVLPRAVLALLAPAVVTVTLAAAAVPAPAAELSVSAAASLTEAFRALARSFEERSPGTGVRLNLAGSPTLVAQVREGAPVDVVALADEVTLRPLVEAGAVETPRIFARNRLVIVVPDGNPRGIHGLADLARPGLVVALAAPAVPAGRYARQAFAAAGVTPPAASEELDVKAVVMRVALGEADAGVAYATDVRAASAAGAAVQGIALREAHDVVARYPIAVVARASHPRDAAAFVAFVRGDEGRRILAEHGFLPP